MGPGKGSQAFQEERPRRPLIGPIMIAAPRRVLIVEDELLIALSIADILDEAGFETVGPAGTVREWAATTTMSG